MSEPTPAYGSPHEPAPGASAAHDATHDSEERKAARARLEAQRSFRAHAVAYVLVNLLLVGIWAATGGGDFWPVWSMLGWGIGLAFHAFGAYGPQPRPITDADVDAEIRRRRGER